jgi:lipoprotein-anchoring transpeptidase ErfK/SrfK
MRYCTSACPLVGSRNGSMYLWVVPILLLALVVPAVQSPRSQRVLKTASQPALARLNTELIAEAEHRLADLGYWIGPAHGVFSAQDRQALIAFQKVQARKATGKLSLQEVKALRSATSPTPVESDYPHIEVDLAKQVLYVVGSDGRVSATLPVSTGSGKRFTIRGRSELAITPTGKFTVYRKINGWRKSPLGLLYYPNYISDGVAIHGNPSVPVYPASHGCIRVPMFAAVELSKMAPVGTVVIVHKNGKY